MALPSSLAPTLYPPSLSERLRTHLTHPALAITLVTSSLPSRPRHEIGFATWLSSPHLSQVVILQSPSLSERITPKVPIAQLPCIKRELQEMRLRPPSLSKRLRTHDATGEVRATLALQQPRPPAITITLGTSPHQPVQQHVGGRQYPAITITLGTSPHRVVGERLEVVGDLQPPSLSERLRADCYRC